MADIFQTTFSNAFFFNENFSIAVKISLKFVPSGTINNIPASVKIMAWRRPGNKPLSEPMMVSLPTHICITRPQRVKLLKTFCFCTSSLENGNQSIKCTLLHPCKLATWITSRTVLLPFGSDCVAFYFHGVWNESVRSWVRWGCVITNVLSLFVKKRHSH